MKKDNPYKVPENYFDNLGSQIQEKIKKEESLFHAEPEKQSLLIQLKPYMWMAASIFVLVFAVRIILSVSISPEYKIASINADELPANAAVDTLDKSINDSDALFFDDLSEASSDDIIDYLSDTDIDTETLIANL